MTDPSVCFTVKWQNSCLCFCTFCPFGWFMVMTKFLVSHPHTVITSETEVILKKEVMGSLFWRSSWFWFVWSLGLVALLLFSPFLMVWLTNCHQVHRKYCSLVLSPLMSFRSKPIFFCCGQLIHLLMPALNIPLEVFLAVAQLSAVCGGFCNSHQENPLFKFNFEENESALVFWRFFFFHFSLL